MALANCIRQHRFRNGEMTQKKLAEYVGVSRQTVNAIERNKYSPSLEVAFRIANIFGTSVENIFFYEPDIEAEHEFADRAIIDVSWQGDDNSGGN